MVMTCCNAAELAKWMVKQLEWKKWKESNLKKKNLGDLQNCTIDVPCTLIDKISLCTCMQ
jgi:hypothetical protein